MGSLFLPVSFLCLCPAPHLSYNILPPIANRSCAPKEKCGGPFLTGTRKISFDDIVAIVYRTGRGVPVFQASGRTD